MRYPGLTIVAVGLILGTGVVSCGDEADQSTAEGTAPEYVTAEAAELTERQVEMIEVVEQYLDAWKDTDGEQVEAFMTADAYVAYVEEGWRFEIADGSLQTRISNGPYDSLEDLDPMVVYQDRVVLTGRINSLNLPWLSVIRFTSSGDVKIVSENIFL
jgi:hypothetical protein